MNHRPQDSSSRTTVDPAAFRDAMRNPASTVAVLTAGSAGQRVGVTVTAVSSLSDSPPMMLACVNRLSTALPVMQEAGAFCLNFLCEGQDDVAAIFAGKGGLRGDDRFSLHQWTQLATGAPVLSQALVAFDCSLVEIHQSSTHAILFGEVHALHHRADAGPLLYNRGSYRYLAQIGPSAI
ncbi:flavin reductase family protein [Devosia sp. A369]